MALVNNRPPMPKTPKVKNSLLIQLYKRQNPHCEVCILDGDLHDATDLHHIIPGTGRTDEPFNIIHLCQRHHTEATEHINGRAAQLFNIMLLAIKLLKYEVDEKKLMELRLLHQVKIARDQLKPKWKAYVRGELLR
jgi:hypothetical protein